MIGLFAVVAWIACGCVAVHWLIRRPGEATDALFIALLLIYFGAPLFIAGILR